MAAAIEPAQAYFADASPSAHENSRNSSFGGDTVRYDSHAPVFVPHLRYLPMLLASASQL